MPIVHATDDSFTKDVLQSKNVTIVDFWAPWCGPCKMMEPIIEKIAKDYEDRVSVVKVNIDDNQEYAQKYQVMSIPTTMIFKDGKPVDALVGAMPAEKIIERLKVVV